MARITDDRHGYHSQRENKIILNSVEKKIYLRKFLNLYCRGRIINAYTFYFNSNLFLFLTLASAFVNRLRKS